MPVIRLALVLFASAAVLAGCERFQPFEQVCATRLAAPSVTVVTEPVRYTTDLSRSVRDLTTRQSNPWGREVMGLVSTELKSEVILSARGLADRSGSRYCIRPDVTVRLAFSPMTLYVASEQRPGSCAHALTLDHEKKHVRVYEDYLVDVRDDMQQRLLADLGAGPFVYASEAEAEAAVHGLLEKTLAPYVRGAMREVLELQKLVDSSREYERLDREQARCSLGEAPSRTAVD